MFDHFVGLALKGLMDTIVSSPPGIRGGGNDFCVISQAGGGQLLNFKSKGGDTFREGKMILGSQVGGGTALS